MKLTVKNAKITIAVTIYQDALMSTKYSENKIEHLIEDLLNGGHKIPYCSSTGTNSPLIVNDVDINKMDDNWNFDE